MSLEHASIVTIINVKSKRIQAFLVEHDEELSEYEETLGEDEIMYVNELGKGKHDDNDE